MYILIYCKTKKKKFKEAKKIYNKYSKQRRSGKMKIAVAGTGYVGLSLATLLSQKK